MCTLPVRWIRLAVLLIPLLCWGKGNVLFAQELSLAGVGPINHSLAGTAVALPRDSAGAIFWNPATVSFLEQSEFQLGMGRHNAPWYGDEFVAGTIGVGVLVFAWLCLAAISDDNNKNQKDDLWNWEDRQKQNDSWLVLSLHIGCTDWCCYPNSPPRPTSEPKPHTHRKVPIRVPTLSYVYQPPDSDWSYGLAISEYGATKVGALAIGDVVGISEYPIRAYEFVPTVSYKVSRQFSLGVSPIFSIEEMPNASLPIILTQDGALAQNQRSKAGFGVQTGMYYAPTQRLRFGASVRTPLLISRYTYRWIDPITGELDTQRLHFSQDSAFRIALGVSHTLPNEKTTFAADFRYSDYSHASALYDIPASFDLGVKKQGISRAVYSLALGAEYRPWDIIAFRMGYQWNHAVSPDKTIIYNTGLPIQSGHSIHYGVTFFFSEHFDLSFSSSNSFGGSTETIHTENGSVSFCRNPNRSNFWAAARVRF